MSRPDPFAYGCLVMCKNGTAVFIGLYAGMVKLPVNGGYYGLGQTQTGTIFMGPINNFTKYNQAEAEQHMLKGSVLIKDRSEEPAERVLPPLTPSKF